MSGGARLSAPRVGIGYDSHKFAPPGPLILGGVPIPSDVHLEGHSDGDAAAHAITDAILGAAAAGDVGEMFSDRDPANKGRDLMQMLRAGPLIKRDIGVKDISTWLPGHGGFFDRLDSILPSAAVAYVIFLVVGAAG